MVRWRGESAKVQAITPHELRHSCASLAVSANVNVLALARMLGHADASVTLRVYADLFDSDLDRAAESIHAALCPAGVRAQCAHGTRTALRYGMKKPLTWA
ncbi:tyrosine-type recombinase/integrase [Nocardia salmonicida]|uniref:tyrosine-type recombinase/integrase n=1 Tax=Nocardia salmonicida TaxID=53431 RepID=UPI0007C6DEDB|nr:tyrosine-type recombinase/integrase [Nocardia salmonicida]